MSFEKGIDAYHPNEAIPMSTAGPSRIPSQSTASLPSESDSNSSHTHNCLNENSARRESGASPTRHTPSFSQSSIPSPTIRQALYAPSAQNLPPILDDTGPDVKMEGTGDSRGTLSEKVHAILNSSRSGYGPISLFTPPGTRRSSANDDEDVEAGAPVGLVSFVTSKRRQARQGRWVAFIILAGGIAYFVLSNMMLNDWIRDKVDGRLLIAETYDYEWASEIGTTNASAWLGPGVRVLPEDRSHVLVPRAIRQPVELLQPFKRIHAPSLIAYYVTGELYDMPSQEIPLPTIDMVYTFVNASSPYLEASMALKREEEGLPPTDRGASRHWRDNGEIRGSIRSSVQSLGETLGKVHLISADFELDSITAGEDLYEQHRDGNEVTIRKRQFEEAEYRIGQIPTWLDTEADQDRIKWHFHSEIFRLPQEDGRLEPRVRELFADERTWREDAMPSFNSFPIESKLGWLEGLSENFVYSNDDMFLTAPLELTDYHHPMLGPVIRVAGAASLGVKPVLTPDLHSSSGEWGGLQHAALLLKNRFTPRIRNYMMHMPKAMTKSMVHEASIMFAPELSVSATRAFRISKRGEADVHFAWLTSQLRIERWREALLWSWAVARLGGSKGGWDEADRLEVLDLLNVKKPGDEQEMSWFEQGPRETISGMEQIMDDQQWTFPRASDYIFSSLDGHIPPVGGSFNVPQTCAIRPDTCFPPELFQPIPEGQLIDAEAIFKRIAFDEYKCGDCLIVGLVAASGKRGLEALFPRADQTFKPMDKERQMWDRSEPMLPLVSTWEEGKFGVQDVVKSGQDVWEGSTSEGREDGVVRLRDWCVKLLSRYVYSLAESHSLFLLSHNGPEMQRVLENIDSHKDVAMTCINDDQPDGSDGSAGRYLGQWMEGRFGGWEAAWERKNWAWVH